MKIARETKRNKGMTLMSFQDFLTSCLIFPILIGFGLALELSGCCNLTKYDIFHYISNVVTF